MRVPGRKLALRSVRWARSRIGRGALVLGYHRLGDPSDDPFGLAVASDDFAAHLDVIARRAHLMRLRDAVEAFRNRRAPRRAVVITFDDGYADTVTDVLPLLERTGSPATVFVTPGRGGGPFWWDELADLIERAGAPAAPLTLSIRGVRRTWSLGGNGVAGTALIRRRVLHSIAEELRMLSEPDRNERLSVIRRWSGQTAPRPRHRSLDAGEMQRLAASPLVEIGAHTMSHPVMTRLPYDEQLREATRSRALLEEVTEGSVTSFSYPHGAYSAATIDAVQQAGFTLACCSRPDVMSGRSNAFALPRLWVEPQDAGRFEAWLDRWLVG